MANPVDEMVAAIERAGGLPADPEFKVVVDSFVASDKMYLIDPEGLPGTVDPLTEAMHPHLKLLAVATEKAAERVRKLIVAAGLELVE